jgi:hypothetical protein
MKDLEKYIGGYMVIRRNPDGSYEIFTEATQHFCVDSISDLTPERFELAIEDFKKNEDYHRKVFDMFTNDQSTDI